MTVKLQLALDTLDGEKAIKIAEQTAFYIDIIEAGTPLIKSVGIQIVSRLKKSHPDKMILADLKSSDVGAYEAEMAFRAGADIVTTQGITTLATIREVQKEANKWGRRAEVDMTGVSDPVAKSLQVMEFGVNFVLYHRSIDEEITLGASWDEHACQIVKELCCLGIDVSIAGGINSEVIPLLCDAPIYSIVVGRGITAHDPPEAAAKSIRKLIDKSWKN